MLPNEVSALNHWSSRVVGTASHDELQLQFDWLTCPADNDLLLFFGICFLVFWVWIMFAVRYLITVVLHRFKHIHQIHGKWTALCKCCQPGFSIQRTHWINTAQSKASYYELQLQFDWLTCSGDYVLLLFSGVSQICDQSLHRCLTVRLQCVWTFGDWNQCVKLRLKCCFRNLLVLIEIV